MCNFKNINQFYFGNSIHIKHMYLLIKMSYFYRSQVLDSLTVKNGFKMYLNEQPKTVYSEKNTKQICIFSITSQGQVAFKGNPMICWCCGPAGPLVWQKGYWERTHQNFSRGQHDSCKPSSWINDLGPSLPGAEVSSALTGITAQPKQTDGHAGSGRADEFHCQ